MGAAKKVGKMHKRRKSWGTRPVPWEKTDRATWKYRDIPLRMDEMGKELISESWGQIAEKVVTRVTG